MHTDINILLKENENNLNDTITVRCTLHHNYIFLNDKYVNNALIYPRMEKHRMCWQICICIIMNVLHTVIISFL